MRQSGRPQVVIVDDQATFRGAARQLLEARGYDVVAEAVSADTALAVVDQHEPTAVLLDVRLGDDDGFALCGTLVGLHPDLAVLLASDGDYDHMTDRIATCGARGFVRKSRLALVDLGEFWPAA
jgi:DNA-binding NarL/FixJ family response regulator